MVLFWENPSEMVDVPHPNVCRRVNWPEMHDVPQKKKHQRWVLSCFLHLFLIGLPGQHGKTTMKPWADHPTGGTEVGAQRQSGCGVGNWNFSPSSEGHRCGKKMVLWLVVNGCHQFYFPIYKGNRIIIPTDFLYFSEGLKPPTSF